MRDERGEPSVYLHPGDVFAAENPHRISTVLGPCVAVALWDPVRRIGGMNHVALPHAMGRDPMLTKLAGPGTRVLIEKMRALGAAVGLEARLFGGADISAGSGGWNSGVGARNVDAVREVLEAERILLMGEDVLGKRGRKVVFCTGTGTYRVTLL